MAVKDYKTNPDENTTISGINIAEGCPPSGINNAIRQLMADVKADHDTQAETNESLATAVMTGATASAAGKVGLVPAPEKGAHGRPLRGDGTWADSLDCDISGLAAGNLPLEGGRLTGNLAMPSCFCDNQGNSVTFGIGTAWNDGSSLTLYGKDVTSGGVVNGFQLRAGQNSVNMSGFPSGQLTWGGKNVVRSVNNINADVNGNVALATVNAPNYGGAYQIGAEGHAPNTGYLFFHLEGYDGTYVLNIGGQYIFNNLKIGEHWGWSGLFPVAIGTYYKISGPGQYAAFYPAY